MKFFIPRQRDDVPFNRAGRAIKKSANVCVSLAVNLESATLSKKLFLKQAGESGAEVGKLDRFDQKSFNRLFDAVA